MRNGMWLQFEGLYGRLEVDRLIEFWLSSGVPYCGWER